MDKTKENIKLLEKVFILIGERGEPIGMKIKRRAERFYQQAELRFYFN